MRIASAGKSLIPTALTRVIQNDVCYRLKANIHFMDVRFPPEERTCA